MAKKGKKAAKPGKRPKFGKRMTGKDVVRTEAYETMMRVPINPVETAHKERQIRENLTAIAEHEEKMAPHKKAIRELRDDIEELRFDVENSSEEKAVKVYALKDFNSKNVQVFTVDGDEMVDEHTMDEKEAQRAISDKRSAGEDDEPPAGD